MLTALWKKRDLPSETVETSPSMIGRRLVVRGVLDGSGEVHIRGRVFGRLNAKRVVIDIGGYLEGDIVAEDVLLSGNLIGRVFALSVIVAPSAFIKGRIFHNTVSVAREARVEGRMPWRPVNFFETLEELPKEQA